MERAIHISSINRGKTGENRPDNFLIKFNPTLKLDPVKKKFSCYRQIDNDLFLVQYQKQLQ